MPIYVKSKNVTPSRFSLLLSKYPNIYITQAHIMAAYFIHSLILLVALSTSVLGSSPHWYNTEIIPAPEYTGETLVNFTSNSYGLDAQHVHKINSTAWEWYYFDAVSADGLQSVVLIMYTAPLTAFFGGGPPDDIIVASISASTPTQPEYFAGQVAGSSAIVTSVDNGASGVWTGTGFQFTGASDLSKYTLVVNSPALNVSGKVAFTSVAPAHYPCGPAEAGQNLEVMPHIG